MCIAPKIYAKTHFPSCSIKEAKSNKTMNMPEDILLQLILDWALNYCPSFCILAIILNLTLQR